jgi:hypothetical protein
MTKFGSSIASAIKSDPYAIQALGLKENSLVVDRLDEACRLIQYENAGKGRFYQKDATDEEIIQEIKLDSKRFDAGEGEFLQRDLEVLDPRRYEILRQEKEIWRDIVPVVNLNAPGMQTQRYQMVDFTGTPELKSDGATDAPMVNNKGSWYTRDVYGMHLGYNYTIDELRAHIHAGVPLETERIRAVNRGYSQANYEILFNGQLDQKAIPGLDGMINHTGVTNVVAHTSAGTNVTWVDKIAASEQAAVVKDITDLVSAANVATQDRFWNERVPGTIGIPLAQYNLINATPMNTANASNVTILAFALDNVRGLANIIPIIELDGKGTGATDLMMGWIPQEEIAQNTIAMEMMWQPMERRGQIFHFYSDMKFLGFLLRYTASMYQIYGI